MPSVKNETKLAQIKEISKVLVQYGLLMLVVLP